MSARDEILFTAFIHSSAFEGVESQDLRDFVPKD